MIVGTAYHSSVSGAVPKRLLLTISAIVIAIALVVIRPWDTSKHECVVTVRPGESIQAAIDAARDGDVICLARGTWAESLVIDKSLTLVGRGPRRTIIEPDLYHRPGVSITGISDTVNVKLVGLTITREPGHTGVAINGNAVAEISDCRVSGLLYGIRVADSAHLILSGSTVSDSKQRGVVLRDSARASMSRSRIVQNLGAGLWLLDSAEAVLVDCQVSGNPGRGLWLRDTAVVTLTDCSVSGNTVSGLWLTGRSEAQIIRSEISGSNDPGIVAEDSATVDLRDTRLLSSRHGMELWAQARATVVNSVVSGNRWDGIRVQDSAGLTISQTVISANMRGIGLDRAGGARISDCLIEENSRYGVFSWSMGEVRGEDNIFRANGVDLGGNLSAELRLPLAEPAETAINWPDKRYASLQQAIDALLPGGRLALEPGTYTGGLTIGTELSIQAAQGDVTLAGKNNELPVFSLVDGADLRLEGVTVSGGSTGLTASAAARITLVDCTVSGNSQGINLSNSSSAEVIDCTITHNHSGGILVSGDARAVVAGCSISGHSDYGISAAGSASIRVSDSTLTGNGWDGGIIVSDASEAVLETNTITGNRGYGVATYWHPCFPGTVWFFRGYISGHGNTFAGNRAADVCPAELDFLTTAEGGEFDLRPAPSL